MNETNEILKNWVRKAENDLKNVANNFKSGETDLPTDTMCFHCQQAVEKLLKAYLISKNTNYPFTHNLADLVNACMKQDNSFIEILEKAESLTPFAVEIRYPDDYSIPTLEDTQLVYKIALEIKQFILSKISINLSLF